MIRLGFALPQFGPLAAQADQVARFATEAERMGARSFWVGDRLLAPVHPTVGYPGRDTFPEQFRASLDPLALLAVAATATTGATIGTDVLNLPLHPPVVVARSLTTLDLLSGGRLVPGFGIGWSPEDYQAAGIPWARRGARLDESLDALEELWDSNPAEYQGELVTVPRMHAELRPAQRPRPPIYLGAMSAAALRRIGRRADGWLPAGEIPAFFSAESFVAQRAVIDRATHAAGRDPRDVATVLRANAAAGTSVEQIADALGTVAERTGTTDMFVDLMYITTDVDGMLDLADRLLAATGARDTAGDRFDQGNAARRRGDGQPGPDRA